MGASYCLRYVALRAQAEAGNLNNTEPGIEFFFLGLLKYAEIRAKDVFNLPDSDMKKVDEDIDAVKALFKKEGVDTDSARPRLRHELKHGAKSDAARLPEYLESADRIAKARGEKECWGQDLLLAVLRKPTDTILQVCALKGEARREAEQKEQEKKEKRDAAMAEEMSPAFLNQLTGRIRYLP